MASSYDHDIVGDTEGGHIISELVGNGGRYNPKLRTLKLPLLLRISVAAVKRLTGLEAYDPNVGTPSTSPGATLCPRGSPNSLAAEI